MSQVEVKCPRCQHEFFTDDTSQCECPQCGTSIPNEDEEDEGFTRTQIFDA